MADSALAGVFREYDCTYRVETGEIGEDEHGNPIPKVEDRTLTITFKATSNPQVVFQPGADPKLVRGKGTCVKPAVLPAQLGPGSEVTMTWRGKAGRLRIVTIVEDELEVLDDVLGTEFIGEWMPS